MKSPFEKAKEDVYEAEMRGNDMWRRVAIRSLVELAYHEIDWTESVKYSADVESCNERSN